MKYIFVLLLIPSVSFAEEFHFTWSTPTGVLQYKTDAKDWEEAFDRASNFCFDFLAKKEKTVTEDKGLAIIDICANPKSGQQ